MSRAWHMRDDDVEILDWYLQLNQSHNDCYCNETMILDIQSHCHCHQV